MLGGTTTSAGINVPGLFRVWGRQLIAGIGWELVSRATLLLHTMLAAVTAGW